MEDRNLFGESCVGTKARATVAGASDGESGVLGRRRPLPERIRKRGISYLEYALLAALVGIVGAVGVMKYGKAINVFFTTLGKKTTDITKE